MRSLYDLNHGEGRGAWLIMVIANRDAARSGASEEAQDDDKGVEKDHKDR